jgi:hypothetical protein
MANRNVETLRKAHEAFSAHDHERASRLASPRIDFTDHGRGQKLRSRQEFLAWLKAFEAIASDVRLVDARYIDGGDWVTAQFRAVGTQDGPMDKLPPSGKRFTLDVCEVWHFNAQGEADEGHNYSDAMGLMIQLGHLAPPS